MQTRSSFGFSTPETRIKRSSLHTRNESNKKSKRKHTITKEITADYFDNLPDDLVIFILCKLSSTAASPADLIKFIITCKRMFELGQHPLVLYKASAKVIAVRATNWSDSAHRFLRRCVDAGNLAACYALGMIEFYCLYNHEIGASLMETAARGSHAAALYSLAIIRFNGSGGSEDQKNPHVGGDLCRRAALLGHADALQELGIRFIDGYGIPQNVARGRQLLIKVNTLELATIKSAAEMDPVNRFMTEWFEEKGGVEGLRVCSNGGCGRQETRRYEFGQCIICRSTYYCSRACQANHWEQVHKNECTLVNWLVF